MSKRLLLFRCVICPPAKAMMNTMPMTRIMRTFWETDFNGIVIGRIRSLYLDSVGTNIVLTSIAIMGTPFLVFLSLTGGRSSRLLLFNLFPKFFCSKFPMPFQSGFIQPMLCIIHEFRLCSVFQNDGIQPSDNFFSFFGF